MKKENRMKLGLGKKREWIFQGAFQGIKAWTVYGLVECWFLFILPWIIHPRLSYTRIHWETTALSLGMYLITGMLLGTFFGLVSCAIVANSRVFQKTPLTTYLSLASTFTVVLFFALNLSLQWFERPNPYLLPSSAVCLSAMIFIPLSSVSDKLFRRLRFFTNNWSVFSLLIGLPWISTELLGSYSKIAKIWATFAFAIGVLSICFSVERASTGLRNRWSLKPAMQRNVFTSLLLALAVLIVLGLNIFLHQPPGNGIDKLHALTRASQRPNVLLIVMDTVAADHLSLYGYQRNTSPHLKNFAEHATLYTNAIAPSDMTLASHASLFTGLYASHHGAYNDPGNGFPLGRPLGESFDTLSELFSKEGYATLGVAANYGYLGYGFGLNRGFQYYSPKTPFFSATNPQYLRKRLGVIWTYFTRPFDLNVPYCRAEDINKEAFNLLGKLKKAGKTFFLFLNYMDAHDPYIPPPPFDSLYPGKDESFTTADFDAVVSKVMKLDHPISGNERRHLESQYDGEISYLDLHLSKLLAYLKALDLYENTLIIITSDHGEAFGRRNLLGHGVSVYEDQIHVPLIIKYPLVNEARVKNETVSLVDLMPTILEVSGSKMPVKIDGQSLITPDRSNSRKIMSESFPNGYLINWHPRFKRVERAIYLGQFKLISSTAGKRELYDLSKDPFETVNLYGKADVGRRKIEPALERWLSEARKESGLSPKLDKATIDRLKSLGYAK